VRHLSFGDYFPGKQYPLDGVQKLHMPGAAEVRRGREGERMLLVGGRGQAERLGEKES
jgi:hypothetical protein